jgi:hypothetical protein
MCYALFPCECVAKVAETGLDRIDPPKANLEVA